MISRADFYRLDRRRKTRRLAFSLLELLLVLVLLGILGTLLIPSLGTPLAQFRVDRAANEWASVLRKARLRAMETGRAHAVSYMPGTDRFVVWSVDASDPKRSGTSYLRRTYHLAGSENNQELQFLDVRSDDTRQGALLVEAQTPGNILGQFAPKLGSAEVPIVFTGTGAADRNRRMQIKDIATNRVTEISVTALTGTVTVIVSP